jgi:peptidoglycan/LPS O-acetylase OafA/YrhL
MGDECEDYWWTNVLFINNFWPDFEGNGCFGHAWYLANDFQFFLITPPILYIYYNRKTLYGWISVASLVAIHLIVTGILVGVNNFRIVGGEDDDEKF